MRLTVRLRNALPLVAVSSALCIFSGLPGCGGSGAESGGVQLSGKPAVHATMLAGDQSLVGGMSYPFALVRTAAPAGSKIGRARTMPAAGSNAATLTFNTTLNLYERGPVTSGNTASILFFTDAAGKNSAGSLTIAEVGATTFNPSYASYPVTLNGNINLTAGNLVCNGKLQLVFMDSSGKNTISGNFNLPKNGIQTQFDMSLDDSGNAGGSATIVQNNITLNVTNMSGSLSADLSGDVTVKPYNWSGTGSFSLATGAYTLKLNVGTNQTDTGSVTNSGGLDISYSDGTAEQIPNPITAPLTGGGTTGSTSSGTTGTTSGTTGTTSGTTGTTSGTTGTLGYGTPVVVPGTMGGTDFINARNRSKALVGSVSGTLNKALYWASPTATPVSLAALAGGGDVSAVSISDSGSIVGWVGIVANNGLVQPIYWASPTSTPVLLALPPKYQITTGASAWAMGINSSGQIVGYVDDVNFVTHPVYWSSPNVVAQDLPGGIRPAVPTAITNGGVIVGSNGSLSLGDSFVWKSPTSTPIDLKPMGGHADWTVVMDVNASGNIVGYQNVAGENVQVAWNAPGYAPTTLPSPSLFQEQLTSINDAGAVIGGVENNTSNTLTMIWQPGKTGVDFSSLDPQLGPRALANGGFVFNDYSVVLSAYDANAGATEMIYVPVTSGPRTRRYR